MHYRPGMTYAVIDCDRLPLVFGLDPQARAGVYSPEVFVHWRRGRGYVGGHSIRIRVPHVTFARGYRLRRFGGLHAYRIVSRIIHTLGRNRARA